MAPKDGENCVFAQDENICKHDKYVQSVLLVMRALPEASLLKI